MLWSRLERAALREHSAAWVAAAYAALVAVGIVDYLTGPPITFAAFYLVPVAIVAWLSGRVGRAVLAALVAAMAWFVAELASSRIAESRFVYTWNFSVRLIFLLLVAALLAHLKVMLVRERRLARVDGLTGLLNGRAFREIAEAEIERARRYGHPLSIAFLDLDDFKRINDSRGHAAGDRALAAVGATLRSHLRRSDVAARLGGDEFVVLLPLAGEADARAAMTNALAKLQTATSGQGTSIAASVGLVTYPSAPPSVDRMLERADQLMYAAKSRARGDIVALCESTAEQEA